MVAGNPARIIGHTDESYQRVKKLDFGTKNMTEEEKRKKLLSAADEHFIRKGYMKDDKTEITKQ